MSAVIVRCSFFPPSPLSKSSGGVLPRRLFAPLHPRGNASTENIDAISSPRGKIKMLLHKTSTEIQFPSKSVQSMSSDGSMTSMQDVQMGVLEETLRLGIELSHSCNVFLKYISRHKGLASSFAKTLFIANASSMILPFRALAETCENNNSVVNMPLLFAIATIGATVGGLLARQRRRELAKLNDQLRQINAALRRQAKIESYAPNLSYAPVGRVPETEVIVDPRKEQLITNLRTGKNYLRNQDPEKAFVEFNAAFELADSLGDHIEKKKAARGLGASLQRQGRYREAIKYHSKVLEIAQKAGESSGSTEAYGSIADCYTELGELERAGKFYDKYIARLETD